MSELKRMKPEDVLLIVKSDIDKAKADKDSIDKKMAGWRDTYNAELKGNELEGRSKFVSKDTKKAIHWYVPNAMKPFMSTDDMVETIPRTADDIQRAKSQATLLNYQFSNDFPRYDFLYQSIFIMAQEGTIVARTGWDLEEETEDIPFTQITEDEYNQLVMEGAEIVGEPEMEMVEMEVPVFDALRPYDQKTAMAEVPVYSGTVRIKHTIKSRPTAEIIKNEDFFIDSGAVSINTAEFVAQRIVMTMSELREQEKTPENPNGIYENVEDIIGTNNTDQSALGANREAELKDQGHSEDTESDDQSRKKVEIYEYYGKIDMNGDGIAEPIVCVYSGNTILRLAENPFPDKKPPYIGCPYSAKPFSFWGDAMAAFVEDTQQVKTAIMRTFIDLLAHSTNGMKHYQKGTIDALNIRKLREAKIGTAVEWRDINGYKPEVKNDIPSSLMQMYELFSAEVENETGITKYNQGLDAKSLNKTATGITAIMNQSQMRIWETTSRFAESYLKELFRKWISYNQTYLEDEIAVRVAGDKYVGISPDDIGGKLDMKINVAIAGSHEQKAQYIVQLLQMSAPMVANGIVPPAHLAKLLAALEDIWGFQDLASELRDMAEQAGVQLPPEGDPNDPNNPNQPQGV